MNILEIDDIEYPFLLKRIANPPKQLYIEGNKEILNSNMIAVVGSRNNTEYGEKWCKILCRDLLEYNLNIVSGMALGIDSIAHCTSIQEGVPTIAVLPCGFDNIYPAENTDLFKRIIDGGGVVISEYSPNVKANSQRFIERNRIVAGLSIGVLVIEAAHRSGTSITAKIAKSNGKKVFCIPGSLEYSKSNGTNKLIKEGAFIATDVKDIIDKYKYLKKVRKKRIIIEETKKGNIKEINSKKEDKKSSNYKGEINDIKKEETIDEKYKSIYELIPKEGINVNDMIIENRLNPAEVMEKITMLEIMGKVKRKAGNKYFKL